ncbi:3-oxoacyl-[acyl-carrier-protein] synthase III C-terminal domain-containing protein [Streptomyces sp. NPDC058193]|uniref:3-oxoacyl-[acyl-carrier-protein] synthase III C-terminal domain-containing protein n=1 Tax=Streptomyces sp. NPDC058193 TaxID=3346373 RepID=UPI0036ECF8E8
MLYLRRIVPFVPPHSTAISDLRERLDLSRTELRLLTRFLGLDRIVVAEGLSTLDMLLSIGQEALADLDRSRMRCLIHAHTVQHVAPPGLRWMDVLRTKLGLDGATAFSMSHQGCAVGLNVLKVAETLLAAEPAGSTALVLVGEKALSSVMQHLPGTSVLGDATVGLVVGLEGPGDALLSVAHHTRGEFHQAMNMPEEMQHHYTLTYAPELASVMLDAVHAAGLGLDGIDLVLPHNVNRYSWTTTARRLGLPLDRIYLKNVPKTGHCFCADPFINLSTARAEGAVRPGATVLLVSAGQGGTFTAAVARTSTGQE